MLLRARHPYHREVWPGGARLVPGYHLPASLWYGAARAGLLVARPRRYYSSSSAAAGHARAGGPAGRGLLLLLLW